MVLDGLCSTLFAVRTFLNEGTIADKNEEKHDESCHTECNYLSRGKLVIIAIIGIFSSVGDRLNSQQFFRSFAIGADLVYSECTQA